MERGTEREEQALREAWAARERQKHQTSAFLLGISLAGTGLLLITFALVSPLELCVHGAGIDGTRCTTQDLSSTAIVIMLIAGSIMITEGSRRIWQNAG